ncbi:putative phage-like protein [Escherichia coli]|uniref:Putative phage-like protein n=1 Tax=Escherichia coli TaxID=562 RepID=A0A376X2E6_ECOLX|nr:putative phage-like protein [Escherichia coli]
MARGIWVSPDEFVAFSEPQKSLTAQIASRSRAIDFYGLGMYLPNPDPILKAQGRDIRIYRELRTDPLVGGCIRRRKAALKSLGAWTGAWSRLCPGLPFHPRHARRSGSVPHHR